MQAPPKLAYVSRARARFFSASTKRLAAGMRPTVSDNATRKRLLRRLDCRKMKAGERHDRHAIYPAFYPMSVAELAAAVRARPITPRALTGCCASTRRA